MLKNTKEESAQRRRRRRKNVRRASRPMVRTLKLF